MNKRINYDDHTIDLELMEIRPQYFRWLYRIDGNHLRSGDDILRTESGAFNQALARARDEIDAFAAGEGANERTVRALSFCETLPDRSGHDQREVSIDQSEQARRRTASTW